MSRKSMRLQESICHGIRVNEILDDTDVRVNPLFTDAERIIRLHRQQRAATVLAGCELCPEDQAISANYAGVFQQARRD